MSDITKLTDKIIQDAKKRQEHYLKDASQKTERREELRKKQLTKQKEERLAAYEKEIRAEMSLEVSDLHIKSRAKVLAAKEALLDELFQEALESFEHMSETEFTAFLEKSLKKSALSGNVQLILGEESEKYADKATIEKWITFAQPDIELSVAKVAVPRRGGFLLKQDTIEYNFLFESLLQNAEEELSSQLLDLLFLED